MSDVDAAFRVPDIVRTRAENLGDVGIAWLAELPQLVTSVAEEWGLTVGMPLVGGSAAFVAPATLADGTEAILKLAIPGPDNSFAPSILAAANGRGYVKLLRNDASKKAMLLERLGRGMDTLGLPVEWQLRSICATHLIAWQTPPPDVPLTTGAQKAEDLAAFLGDMLAKVEHTLSARTIEVAYEYCERRRKAYSPDRAVLGHGDGHAANTLLVPGSAPMQFKFIDPEGLFIEREYDMAICMRGNGAELLAGDAVALGRQRAEFLSGLTGVDPVGMWEWGLVERLTTGLLLKHLNEPVMAEEYLSVAELWAGAES